MRVHFDLPDKVWLKLADLADENGVKVGQWLADEVEAVVVAASSKRRVRVRRTPNGANPYREYRPVEDPEVRARIAHLRATHRSLPEIEREVGVSRQKVGATLWDMGIKTGKAAAS